MVDVITVLISGIFGLTVAVVTVWLSTRKDREALRRSEAKERLAKIENLYIDKIAVIETVIRFTERRMDYAETFDEMARTNARMKLCATPEVLQKADRLSNLLYEWSHEFRQGMPQPTGDGKMAIISSTQTPHRQKAEEIYPKLMEATLDMIDAMKNHLRQLDSGA